MVAVIAIGIMQVSGDEVVNVITMRNSLVAAIFAMLVVCVVTATSVSLGTGGRVGSGDSKNVLINMSIMKRVKMAIMKIIDMVHVPDCNVAATRTVLVGMVFVDLMSATHEFISFQET